LLFLAELLGWSRDEDEVVDQDKIDPIHKMFGTDLKGK